MIGLVNQRSRRQQQRAIVKHVTSFSCKIMFETSLKHNWCSFPLKTFVRLTPATLPEPMPTISRRKIILTDHCEYDTLVPVVYHLLTPIWWTLWRQSTEDDWKSTTELWNLTPCGSTRWVRVKRHAIHHRGSSVHRRLVENILLIVTDLCTVSQYSISLRTYHHMTSWCMSLISVDLIVVYWSVLHLILDSAWVWYILLLELKIPTLARHWVCLLCLRH